MKCTDHLLFSIFSHNLFDLFWAQILRKKQKISYSSLFESLLSLCRLEIKF